MFACDDSTSMLWARVVRGAASSAKAIVPMAASCSRPGRSKGSSMPTSAVPGFISISSSVEGRRTFSTSSAEKAAAASPMVAPAAS